MSPSFCFFKEKKMKKIILICLLLSFSNAKAGVAMVEGCNLNEGYTIADVVDHTDLMNTIMDAKGYKEKRFGAMVMQPYFEQERKSEFDFYQFEYWGNYEIFGNDMNEWFENGKGDEYMQKWGEMTNCRALNMFSTITTREYPGD